MIDDRHSRSIQAGYQPELLHRSHVFVAGLGALGQNTVQDLSLLGIGDMWLVDFDSFEPHNATRSPYYPTKAEQERHDLLKAPIVAERARSSGTAPDPQVSYSVELVQLLGDAPIRWADVVVSAVDDVNARGWLAERSRIHGKPMVEGGFRGFAYNLAVFSGIEGPCYRCLNPERRSAGSCTQYALDAEAANIVPAIQTAAATLGGYQAEAVVALLHGDQQAVGRQVFGNVRMWQSTIATLQADPDCPGVHDHFEVVGSVQVGEATTLGDLCDEVLQAFGPGELLLAEPVVVRQACTRCLTLCQVGAAESLWLRTPRCINCGGIWQLSDRRGPSSSSTIAIDAVPASLREVAVCRLGLKPGGSIRIRSVNASLRLLELIPTVG